MTAYAKTTLFIQAHPQLVKVSSFLWHFVQMFLAMEAGMMIYHKLIMPRLAPFGFHQLMMAQPLICYWLMVVSMVLGMIALMCFHRSSWRYPLEMTVSMVAPLAMLTVMVLCHWLPTHYLYQVGDPVMFLAMAVYMLICPEQHMNIRQSQACHAE